MTVSCSSSDDHCLGSTLSVEQSVAVFYDNVVRSRGVGLKALCFSGEHGVLFALACLHGVDCPSDLTLECIQHRILHHLISGECFRSAEQNASLSPGSRRDIVCAQMSHAFASSTDMSLAFVRRVVDDISFNQKLNVKKITSIALALMDDHYDVSTFSTPNNVKRDAMRLFTRFLNMFRCR